MAFTQARAAGAFTGTRYGSFAGRGAPGEHPVDTITQPRASAAHTGRRYGSFAGRAETARRITQALAFGAHTGRRYGSFADRIEAETDPDQVLPGGGRRRRAIKIDRSAWPAEYIALRNDEDDQLLVVIAQMIAAGIIY